MCRFSVLVLAATATLLATPGLAFHVHSQSPGVRLPARSAFAAASTSRGSVLCMSAVTARDAKEELAKQLQANEGDTKNDAVAVAVDALSKTNPTTDGALQRELLKGAFATTGFNFPDGKRGPLGWECTLGRLAFNLFEPTKLPVSITHIVNTLEDVPAERQGDRPGELTYDLVNSFVARSPESGVELRGEVAVSGVCWPDSKDANRLRVAFGAGELRPAQGQDLAEWEAVFKPREGKEKPRVPLGKKLTNLMLKLFMGFQPPADAGQGVQRYTMNRPPEGYLDILYLDDALRVTRGNRGSIVVVERV
ncbi:hypothetical protein JKP88DRAFT_260815 [Tribonema minus]|uniref:Plastid lipid-associated protein/fibrillin conserved domain-containing protein n=1 Tax=Tribonema minus TaxID=303371 RepID=A0A835ZKX0_9STRA|nr:hypothetical protein JKP88DRAFT_260815 [Tribonema minus]